MADKRISDLNLHTALELSDSLPIINNGETKKTTYGSLYYGIRDGVISGSNQISDLGFITGVLDVDNYVTTSSYNTDSSSFDQRIINATNEQSLVGFATTGSNTFNENQIISGSLFISGTTELGGNIVPKTARGATLGTLERPFSEIFVSSGSINIASDTIGDPNTTLTNIGGNILVSAGGMRLVGDASFIAVTGSFQYLSGSFTHIGSQFNEGDIVTTGSLAVSGSTIMIGNNTLQGNTLLSGSVNVIGNQTISGSMIVSESLNINNRFYVDGNKQFNYGLFSDLTTQSGSLNTAYPMKLNTTDMADGFSIVSGSRITAANNGTYNLQFSAQLLQTTNNAPDISIWLRKDGTNVPNTNTELTIEKVAGGGKLVAAWNFIVQLNATQYVELMWSSTRSDTQLAFIGEQSTPTRPMTPSVIVTMTQIA